MDRNNRSTKLLIGLGVVLLVLLGKLFYVQIVNESYKTDADNNSMTREMVYPPRGVIYDRNGKLLVGNKICYEILVTPREVAAFDTLALAEALDTTADFIRERMAYYHKYRSRIGWQTLTFLKMVPAQTYLRFAEEQFLYPGFKAQVRTLREYPFNAGGNLLGYISEVSPEFLQDHPDYRSGDYYGRTGLEAAREQDLRGRKGWHIYQRDARGRQKDPYHNGDFDVENNYGAPERAATWNFRRAWKEDVTVDDINHILGTPLRTALRPPVAEQAQAALQPRRVRILSPGLRVQAGQRACGAPGRCAGTVDAVSLPQRLRLYLQRPQAGLPHPPFAAEP